MSFNVAMLEALKAEGLDLDACIRVLAAGERKADRTNAERQARHRARRRSNAVTVTPTAPNDSISNPPEENLSSSDDSQKFGVEQAFDLYNETATKAGLRKAASLTTERRKGIRERLKAHGEDGFRRACTALAASPFCRGENDRKWRADLDFLLQRKSFLRLIEGFYGGTEPTKPATAPYVPQTPFELKQAIEAAEAYGYAEKAEGLRARLAELRTSEEVQPHAMRIETARDPPRRRGPAQAGAVAGEILRRAG